MADRERERVGNQYIPNQEVVIDHFRLVAEQFGNEGILASLRSSLPPEFNGRTSIHYVLKWFRSRMVWDREIVDRFNYVPTLAYTRRGRCGEWAILFTAYLCALGWRARLVLSLEDHMWTELWNATRWVHVDCTLESPRSFDDPMVYARDFHHKITKIIAFEPGGVLDDVTERYRPR